MAQCWAVPSCRCCPPRASSLHRGHQVPPSATRCSQESLGAIRAGCCLLRPHCPSADKSARFAAAFQTLTLMFCDNLAIYISLISSVINIIEAPQW